MKFKALANKLVFLGRHNPDGGNTLMGATPRFANIVLGKQQSTPSTSFQAGGGGVTASGIVAPAQELK